MTPGRSAVALRSVADQSFRRLVAATEPEPSRWAALGYAPFGAGLVFAGVLRFWHLGSQGYNSDEAVYAGQGAAIANNPSLEPFFPVFRAHPLLFQTLLSLGYRVSESDLMGRSMAAAFGIGTIFLTYKTARLLYGRRPAQIAAVLIARAAVVYGLLGGGSALLRRIRAVRGGPSSTADAVPPAWLHVLFWAGLRGAVSVALALSLPAGLPHRDLLQGVTFGIVLFTLIVQGTSTGWVVRRSGASTAG